MKVLVLKARLPYPLDFGASIRTYNLLKQAARNHELTLLSFYDAPEDKQYQLEMEKLCARVILVDRRLQKGRAIKALRAVGSLFDRHPYSVAVARRSAMREAIRKELASQKYDLIHADTLHVSCNLLGLKTPPVVLNEHNVEHLILQRKYDIQETFLARKFWYSQWQKLKRFEQTACRQFERVITVSENDKQECLKLAPDAKVDVVPNGVDTEAYQEPPATKPRTGLVFTGLMNWHPNEDGIEWFLREIAPQVFNHQPDTKLTVVGKNPSGRMARLVDKFDNVELTGYVDDVKPYLHQGLVYIVPLRVGGGTRLKILEAMAAGIPVVSTSIGCEGIKVTPGTDILVADQPDEFARKIKILSDDKELCTNLITAGKRLVAEHYDWKIIARSLEASWQKCCE
jgi:glycosyltransferase involved in cell wall biosynthesis